MIYFYFQKDDITIYFMLLAIKKVQIVPLDSYSPPKGGPPLEFINIQPTIRGHL